MPFQKGPASWRRSLDYLRKGSLVFKEKVKVCSVNFHDTEPASDGLRRFVFWHFAQIQYKNPNVQCVQLKNIVKTPFITFHTEEENGTLNSVYLNCYKKTHPEILDSCKNLYGKTAQELELEAQINPANFGEDCKRHCICLVEGQVACPRYKPLPHFMRGKYVYIKKDELEEIRATKPDQEALKEYWSTK